MFCKTNLFTQVRQSRAQPVHTLAVLQPERILRQYVLDLERQFAGASAQFHQPAQERADSNSGVNMFLLHHI